MWSKCITTKMYFNNKFTQNKKTWKHIACIKQKDKKNFRMNVLRKTCKQKMTPKNWMQMNEQRTNPKKNPMKAFKMNTSKKHVENECRP
jgi:hypothetical protein